MSRDFRCGDFVSSRIYQLGGADPGRMNPMARGVLAQLRTAASAEPGTAPAVWSITLDGLPDDVPEAQRERIEAAVHVALTQYAIHQQGKATPMHQKGQPFGLAVRKLASLGVGDKDVHETPVYSRFMAMAQATTLPGLLAHSRGLISQLRSHDIPFDYGTYANDIYWFLTPGFAADVHRRWGRDFHRLTSDPHTPTITTEGEQA